MALIERAAACLTCGKPLTHCLIVGRRRKYCSAACRSRWTEDHRRDISAVEIERRFQEAKAKLKLLRQRVSA